ncbi:MAG: hypothetical protein U1E73_00550 [Planctomycetota bacterium]
MLPILFRPFVLAIAAAAPLAAQQLKNGANVLHIDAGSIEVRDLIDRSAAFLGWNVLATDQELGMAGSAFKLQNAVDLDREACQEFLTTTLSTRSVAVRTLDSEKNLFEIIALNGPRSREVFAAPPQRTVTEVLAHPNLRMPVAVALQLEHINAMIACNSLRPFFAQSGAMGNALTIGSGGSTSTMLISGMQDQVANAIRLVQQCDVKQPENVDAMGNPIAPSPMVTAMQERIAKLEKAVAHLEKLAKAQENDKKEK